METISNELNERQKRMLAFLLTCKTIKEASKKAGVRLATVFKWMRDPEFKAELERLREEIIGDVVNRLKIHCMQATEVLVDLLGSQSETVRRGAANDIISHTQSFMTLRDIEGRVEALEQSIKDKGEQWSVGEQSNVLRIG